MWSSACSSYNGFHVMADVAKLYSSWQSKLAQSMRLFFRYQNRLSTKFLVSLAKNYEDASVDIQKQIDIQLR